MDRAELARCIDHTLLTPEATEVQVDALCTEAAELGVYAVCVSPSRLPLIVEESVAVCTVVGFPSGAHDADVKAAEALLAVERGAVEVDMVLDLARVLAGEWELVEAEVSAVRDACGAALLKVIIESAVLDERQIVGACEAAEAGGAAYVKTSTGFHPAGGAGIEAVRLMRRTVGDRLGVKASGGIRDTATALAMLDAGASRLGLSASRAVLDGLSSRRR